jgi:hypothetical protein
MAKINRVTLAARRFGTSAAMSALVLLSACAHHPKKEPPAPPAAPPAPSVAELEDARAQLTQCLHVQAFKLDDGVSAPAALGTKVARGCLDKIHLLGVLESRQTHDKTGAWVIYASLVKSAKAQGEQAIIEFRATQSAR